MAYGYYQPQQMQYTPPQPQYQPQTQSQGFNWVSGESGAKSWLVGRGETVLLMDSENPIFYLKSSDNAGMPLPLRIFDYSERTQAPNNATNISSGEFVTREEFSALIGKYDELKAMIEKEAKDE
ncbi:MAG: hypothetical protein KBT03_03860 [Bacteroidales bacterium]|nr:hypothetical protein [Candidatus Scybalousia scybalohippi]